MTKHDNSDIREELESLAPNLARLPKTNRKSVPEGYFEDVEDQIVRQLNFLHLDQRKPSIPSGYMDSLEDRIVSLVQDEQKVIPLYKKPVVKYLAAASIVLVLAFIGINRWSDNNARGVAAPRRGTGTVQGHGGVLGWDEGWDTQAAAGRCGVGEDGGVPGGALLAAEYPGGGQGEPTARG